MKVSTPFEWHQRVRLMDERDRLSRLHAELRAASVSRGDYEPHDITDDEAAIQADAIEQRLAGIETALEQLAAGTYGQCRACGEPIARERLEALPAADRCLGCAA